MVCDYLGNGEHSMSVDEMRKILNNGHFLFQDLRTERIREYLFFRRTHPFT